MKNYSCILALAAITFALSSCSTTNFSSVNHRDVLAVQSDFELKKSTPVVESIASLEKVVPTEMALNNKIETKTELSNVPVSNAFEQHPSRKSVKAEMQQFTREQKKELRKAILYAYLGKDLPVSSSSKKSDGPPFIDQLGAAIIAFFIPPLGAGLYFGKDKRTWISLGLFLLFWLPGAIYAIIVILKD